MKNRRWMLNTSWNKLWYPHSPIKKVFYVLKAKQTCIIVGASLVDKLWEAGFGLNDSDLDNI